jgi:hypothetical protein
MLLADAVNGSKMARNQDQRPAMVAGASQMGNVRLPVYPETSCSSGGTVNPSRGKVMNETMMNIDLFNRVALVTGAT